MDDEENLKIPQPPAYDEIYEKSDAYHFPCSEDNEPEELTTHREIDQEILQDILQPRRPSEMLNTDGSRSNDTLRNKEFRKLVLNEVSNSDAKQESRNMKEVEDTNEFICRLQGNVTDFDLDEMKERLSSGKEIKEKKNIQVIMNKDVVNSCRLNLCNYSNTAKGVYLFSTFPGLNRPIPMLLDTGASVNCLSKKVFDVLPNTQKQELQTTTCKIFNASGNKMTLYGKISLPFTVGNTTTDVDFYVLDTPQDGIILSFTWFKQMSGKLDMTKNEVTLQDTEVPCFVIDGLPSIKRVTVAKKYELEPMQEYIIYGKVKDDTKNGNPTSQSTIPMVMEPYRGFVGKHGVVPCSTSIMNGQHIIPIRVLNCNANKVTLHPNTICGFVKPAEVITKIYESTHDDEVGSDEPKTDEKAETDGQECQHKTEFELSDLPEHLRDMFNEACVHLTMKQREQLKDMILKYIDVFSSSDLDVGYTKLYEHDIKVKQGTQPIKQKLRNHPLHHQEIIDNMVEELLQKGFISRSNSPWSSNVLLVSKKDGTHRLCIDYRKLNSVTVPDAHPIPPISQTINALSEAKYFCALDLSSGYFNVPMNHESKAKTAFVTRNGLFEWNRMCFGLINAPSTFQRLMEFVLRNCHWSTVMVYLDDILVYGKTVEETMKNFEEVLMRLQKAGLKLKPKKCHLFKTEVLYLGYIIGRGEVKTNPDKIRDIENCEAPENEKEVRRFLGLTNYYRKFVKNYAEIAAPLNKLLNKDVSFKWESAQDKAFRTLKERLITAPILTLPSSSKEDRYILTTDASQYSIGAVLTQIQDGSERVIAYSSKMMSKTERNYCITRKELLSIVYHVNHFRMFLLGTGCFLIKTDHKSLKSLMNFKDMSPQLARWIDLLSQFNYEIEYVPGTKIKQADFMSRCPGKLCLCDYACSDPCSEDYLTKPCEFRKPEDIVRMLQSEEDNSYDPLTDEVFCALDVEEDSSLPDEEVTKEALDESATPKRKTEFQFPWTYESLMQAQQDDSSINTIVKALEQKTKPKYEDVAHTSHETKALLAQWNSLFLHEGILYRKFITQANEIRYQIIIPGVYRNELLKHFHDTKTAGHWSTVKVYKKLHRKYYWPNMSQDVTDYIRSCHNCQKKKNPRRSYCATLQKYIVGNCFERIGMDVLGPLPQTYNGSKYILVVVDYFSKWVEAYPLQSQSAEETAHKFCSEWITVHGSPLELFTDAGTNFTSELFKNICELFEISKFQAIVRRPNSNGFVEIINDSLTKMISKINELDPHNWDNYLPYLTMALRSSDHCSTGFSANRLVFGREIRMPFEAITPREKGYYEYTPEEYILKLKDYLAQAHEAARNNLQKMFLYRKKAYLNRLRTNRYKLEDPVYYWVPIVKKGECKKLMSFWQGPYFIVQIISDVVYRIQGSAKSASKIVHHNQLKPAYIRENARPDTKWLNAAIQKFSTPKAQALPNKSVVEELIPQRTTATDELPIALRKGRRNVRKPDRY